MLHQFFAVFITMLFSFCHHSAGMHPVESAATAPSAYTVEGTSPILTFPDRQELARQASYADSGCSSCQMTTASYAMR